MSDSVRSDDEDSADAWTDFKANLFNQIVQVKSMGSFATFGIIEDFLNPGISINSQGSIRLPLSVKDAQMLIQASHRAPFGNGTHTVIDESVRKTWQINADDVRFCNPRWQSCLERIVAKVAPELGVAGGSQNVRADFYKLLVYESGAMFKAHRE